jgi:formiminotetrahydrofolate cyclodeaminase
MPRFADFTVSRFLDALASPDPTPGGGTAAAMAAAMGASLLMMVAGLPKSRTNTAAEKAALGRAREALIGFRDRLLMLADDDSGAFDEVMAAYRLPKASDEDKAARSVAIQQALHRATVVPLDTVRAGVGAIDHARSVAEHGNRSAVSDVRVGVGLLEAATTGAAVNVEINLGSLDDEPFRESTVAELRTLTDRLRTTATAARAALG